jgi:hypothetical protein
MNFSFYLFGTPNNSYDQFPLDGNSELFKDFAQNRRSDSQLTIYRNEQLVYYTYVRELSMSPVSYFGVCLIFNGVYCHDMKRLFNLFVNTVDSEASIRGEILRSNKSGKMTFATDKFNNKQVEVESLRSLFQQKIDQMSQDFPAFDQSFESGSETVKYISLNGGNNAVNEVFYKHRHVVVTLQTATPDTKPEPKNKEWFLPLIIVALAIAGVVFIEQFNKPENSISLPENTVSTVSTVEKYEVKLPDGTTYSYSGTIQDGLPEGSGIAIYNDSSIYVGVFNKGLRHGKGKMTFADGYIYTGDYVRNKAEGQGEMLYPNGRRYAGSWKNDLKNGQGVIFDANGTELSRGEWINDNKIK